MIKFPSKPFSLPGFPLIEQALNHFRTAIEGFVRDVNRCPLVTGNLITDVTVGTSWTKIYHKLGRVPQGVVVVSKTGRDGIADNYSERTDTYIEMRAEDVITVAIWVF